MFFWFKEKYMASTLHKITQKQNERSSDRNIIKQFSHQLQLLPIFLSGWGFFRMRFSFLCDVSKTTHFHLTSFSNSISMISF